MDEESQRAVAIWVMFVVPFLLFSVVPSVREQLTLEVIALYWFPPIVLTLIGVLPAPWHSLGE